MKKLIIAIAFLVCANFLFAQETTETLNFKGKVKFVEESSYKFVEKFGEIEVGDFLGRTCQVFNEKGLLVKDTSNISSFDYVLNEKGQIKEINEYEQYNPSNNKELKYKTKNKFNEGGMLLLQFIYNGTGSFDKGFRYSGDEVYKIDSEGELIVEDNEFANFPMESEYDNDGQPLIGDTTYKNVLDTQGNWIKSVQFIGKKQFKGFERKIIYF